MTCNEQGWCLVVPPTISLEDLKAMELPADPLEFPDGRYPGWSPGCLDGPGATCFPVATPALPETGVDPGLVLVVGLLALVGGVLLWLGGRKPPRDNGKPN